MAGALQVKIFYKKMVILETFLAKIVSSLGQLFLFFVVAQLFDVEVVGGLSIAISLMLGVSILSRLGLNLFLVKEVARFGPTLGTKVLLIRIIKIVIFSSVLISILFYIIYDVIYDKYQFGQYYLTIWLLLSAPGFSISYILAGYFKGAKSPVLAILQENGIISLVSAVLVFTCFMLVGEIEPYIVGVCVFISSILVLFWGGVKLRGVKHGNKACELSFKGPQIRRFFVISLSEFVQSTFVFLIAAVVLTDKEIGLLKIAERITLVISFVLIVINSIYAPKFSNLFEIGNHKALKEVFYQTLILGGLIAVPPFFTVMFYSVEILSVFGEQYIEGDLVLMILAVSQFINVLTGSSQLFLNMTNNERVVQNVMLCSLLIQVLSMYLMSVFFGLIGAAVNMALFLSITNLIFLGVTRGVFLR